MLACRAVKPMAQGMLGCLTALLAFYHVNAKGKDFESGS